MEPAPSLDDLLASHLVEDAAFARAYAAHGPEERARLKTCAAMALASRPGAGPMREERLQGASGLCVARRRTARPWALLVMGADLASPVRPLAAACAARLHGVEQVAAAFLAPGKSLPLSVLTALELAGVEQVARLDSAAARELAAFLAQSREPGAVLALGLQACQWAREFPAMAWRGPALWLEPRTGRLGVWAQGVEWDWEALRFAHPDAEFLLCGKDGGDAGKALGAPADLKSEPSLQALLGRGLDALFAPPEVLDAAAADPQAPQLMLGPGCESCWFHAGLGPAVLALECEIWTSA